MRRLLVDSLSHLPPGARIALGPAALHHLGHVLRAQPGLQLACSDGAGWQARAEVVREGATLQLRLLTAACRRPPGPALTLVVPAPRPERAAWLVEKAVELSVGCVHWLLTAHAQPHSRHLRLDRLRRVATAAAQQAGVAHLLEQRGPTALEDYLAQPPPAEVCWVVATAGGMGLRALLAHRAGAADGCPPGAGWPGVSSWTAVVGPEGGLSDAEQAQLVGAGALPLCLGPAVLRVETAALCAAALGRAALVPQAPVVGAG